MKMFPEYLNIGSQGPAVKFLQYLLLAMGYNSDIIPDGNFGTETEIGVKFLQEELGVDQDGCFGPATRAAFLKANGIDINALTEHEFVGETTTADGTTVQQHEPILPKGIPVVAGADHHTDPHPVD